MINRKIILACIAIIMIVSLVGCSENKEPIDLTLWHVYGEQASSPMSSLIEEFNNTVGQEEGIMVSVGAVSNSNKIHRAILASINNEPGSQELPDIFCCYPKTLMAIENKDILVDYNDYFTKEERDKYVDKFVEEGIFDGKLKIFPLAKSTEVFFVNKTLFNRFSQDTNVKLESIITWEDIFKTAEIYAKWVDDSTKDFANDTKSFFVMDYPFNYFQIGVESAGENFFENEKLSFSSKYKYMWDMLARASFLGGVWLGDGYATEALRTGDAISSVASSATVLYYENIVTYDNNESEEVEIISLPYPTINGGEKLLMQRGSGLCVKKSTKEKEEAAVTFIKWLTEADRNAKFTSDLGYVPVVKASYGEILDKNIENLTDVKYKSLYKTINEAINPDYTYYFPPNYKDYLTIEESFIVTVRKLLSDGRKEYVERATEDNKEELLEELVEKYWKELVKSENK